ncbi:S1 RNA-binding domain-containing protein [Acidaminobacterium chupaoyuni]
MPQGIYLPEGCFWETPQCRRYHTSAALERAAAEGTILEGLVTVCDQAHNLIVDCNGITGIIPRSEAALGLESGATKEIAVLSRVGKPVAFQVMGFVGGRWIFSRSRAQLKAQQYFMQNLRRGDVVKAHVTHLEPFGAFVDIGCGLISLIGIEHISVSRIFHPRERFTEGQWIWAAVSGVDVMKGRVMLTHKELLGTWEENAAGFSAGETACGIVRGNEDYGVFVELTPNLSGLAEKKEGMREGMGVSVYIKSILPDKMKIKLIIIDQLELPPSGLLRPEHYRITEGRLERWQYSPVEKNGRVTETRFDEDPPEAL